MSEPRLDETLTTRCDIARTPPEIVQAAASLSAATLHEAAGKIGALPSAIKPVRPSFRVCGPACTVHCPPGDNLWIHRALTVAQPGDVLVVGVSGAYEHGYWGEILSTAARAAGIAGLVIDGGVRDAALLEAVGFPVFARQLCIRGTGKDFAARGWINAPLLIDDTTVAPGDLVFGDEDGVVIIPHARAAAVVDAGRRRDAEEAGIMQRLRAGESSLDIYGWR
jgi:4-hydroxy-4-methyl-2-oxoglutarate aldolase